MALDTMIATAMTVEECAAYLGVSIKALGHWRHENKGPAWFKIGQRVRYRKADVDVWIRKRLRSTWDAEPLPLTDAEGQEQKELATA